jgi:C4-dicarboxylate-specific signal transduction histidine kinase
MAEVAADVLHDIGNLLNSASVSAGIVRDGLRKPWDPLLTRLSERLREAAAEPEAELAEEVGRALEIARVRLHDETLELLSQLDEIREALAEQQRRIKTPLFKQALKLDELVAAAIAEHRAAIDAADIKTQIDCEPLPMILLDGWRVARLLGELIAHALSVLEGRPSPELTITGEAVDFQRFALRVTDNGPRLDPEQRAQLFAYRRCDGRSGGLHRAALAATSMGGHLSARNPETGSGGTTLELELPLEPAGTGPGNGDASGP